MANFLKNRMFKDVALEKAKKKLIAFGFRMEKEIKSSMVSPMGGGRSLPGHPPAVDTGRLRASISTNWSGSGLNRGAVGKDALADDGMAQPSSRGSQFRVVVGTNVEYGPHLEFGTTKMQPRPFIRPVYDRFKKLIR